MNPQATPPYTWVITRDLIDEGRANGEVGPRGAGAGPDKGARFRMLGDDDEVYYYGRIDGDYTGFEPLDDFGTPHAGCTTIEYYEVGNGLGKWVRL